MTDALDPARADGVTAELGGDAALLNGQKSSGNEGIGVLAALVILVVVFGTLVAALVPILLALVGVAVGISSIALLAGALDISTAAPTFGALIGLGVGIDYSLFIVSRYRENRAAGQVNRQALSAAMGSSGTAVFFAGGTVIVSMAALALTGVGFLTSIGLATSLVVLFAMADCTDAAAGAAVAARGPHRLGPHRRQAPQPEAGRGDRMVAAGPPDRRPALAVPGRRIALLLLTWPRRRCR